MCSCCCIWEHHAPPSVSFYKLNRLSEFRGYYVGLNMRVAYMCYDEALVIIPIVDQISDGRGIMKLKIIKVPANEVVISD